jgi:hypothetical protein
MVKWNLKWISYEWVDYFKFFVLYSGDVTADMDHLHVKRIHLVGFSYIVIDDDTCCGLILITFLLVSKSRY